MKTLSSILIILVLVVVGLVGCATSPIDHTVQQNNQLNKSSDISCRYITGTFTANNVFDRNVESMDLVIDNGYVRKMVVNQYVSTSELPTRIINDDSQATWLLSECMYFNEEEFAIWNNYIKTSEIKTERLLKKTNGIRGYPNGKIIVLKTIMSHGFDDSFGNCHFDGKSLSVTDTAGQTIKFERNEISEIIHDYIKRN